MNVDEEKEVLFEHYENRSDNESTTMSDIVGFLESMLVDKSFIEMQSNFCSKYSGMVNSKHTL